MAGAIINYISAGELEQFKTIMESAGNIIKNGGTVIFPTETVYGLGANALDPRAAKRIYKAKGRPSDNPLIVHVSDCQMLEEIALEIGPDARKLMAAYWPGPLTMIFYKKDLVPNETTGGLETVAVRMPSNPIALSLIEEAGLPIAAPSANISGRPSITSGKYAIEEMADRVDMILVDEDSEIGIESTVVDMTTKIPLVLRPGKISQKDILRTIAEDQEEYEDLLLALEEMRFSKESNEAEPRSPGMKYTHYSPHAYLILLTTEEIRASLTQMKKNLAQGQPLMHAMDWADLLEREVHLDKVRVLTTEKNKNDYGEHVLSLGSNGKEIGKNLFKKLRDLDEEGVELIFCEDFAKEDPSEFLAAVMNRIRKAAINIDY